MHRLQENEVRKAYKKAALKFHPDKNPKTTVLFQLISAAADKLSDPEQRKKAEYDATHSKAPPPSQSHPTAPSAPAPGTSARRPVPVPRQPAAPTYETRQEPAYRQPGAPGPANPSYKYTPPSHSDQQSEIYKEFERKRLEADAARRKAAQAAREAEKNARSEAVFKAQEAAQKAKEEQRRREEEYMSRHNKEALDRMHREQGMRDNQPDKHTPRQQGQYTAADYVKHSARRQEESKLPKAYQDDLEKVLNDYRRDYSTKPPEPTAAQRQQQAYRERERNKPVDSYKNYVKEMNSAHDRDMRAANANVNTNANGKRPTAAAPSTESMASQQSPRPGGYKPGNIRILMLRDDCIDLEWAMPACAATTDGIMSELSWKKDKGPWESSGKLIAGNRCRKKNLILGITYRFRARCAVPNPSFDKNNARNNHSVSNMYVKSDWCEELTVHVPPGEKMPADTQPPSKGVESASNYPPHRNEKVRLHPVDRRPVETHTNNINSNTNANVSASAKDTEREHTPLDHNIFGSSGRMAWTAEEAFEDDIVGANARKRKEERREARSRGKSQNSDSAGVNTGAEVCGTGEEVEEDVPGIELYSLHLPGSTKQQLASGREQHPVRAEPYAASQVVGFICCDQPVEVAVTCGDYCKVKYHTLSEFSKMKGRNYFSDGWGWSLIVDSETKHRYLLPVAEKNKEKQKEAPMGYKKKSAGGKMGKISSGASEHFDVEIDGEVSDNSGDDEDHDMFDEVHSKGKWKDHRHSQAQNIHAPSGSSSNLNPNGRSFRDAEEEDVWFEEFDENQNAYYVNQRTGESRWEPPEWVAEVDPESGCTYYIKLNQETAQPLHSTWSRPNFFSKIIRGIPAFDNTRGGGSGTGTGNDSDSEIQETRETPLEKAQSQKDVKDAANARASASDKTKKAAAATKSVNSKSGHGGQEDSIIDEEDVFYAKSKEAAATTAVASGAPTGGGNSNKTNPSPSSHGVPNNSNGVRAGSTRVGSAKVRVDRTSGKKNSPPKKNNNMFSHFPEDEHHYNYFDLEEDMLDNSDADVVEEDEELIEASANFHLNETPAEANLRHYFANQGAVDGGIGGSGGSSSLTSNSTSNKNKGLGSNKNNSMQNLRMPQNKPIPVDLSAVADEIHEDIDEELA